MPLTTLNDFITLKDSYLDYLDVMQGDNVSTPSSKATKKILSVSTYYKNDGTFDHFVEDGKDQAFYFMPAPTNAFVKLGITNSTLLRIAGTAYAEAYNIQGTVSAIPFVVYNRYRIQKKSGYSTYSDGSGWRIIHTLLSIRNKWTDQKYYDENASYKAFMDSLVANRNTLMVLAICMTCRADLWDTAVVNNQTPPYADNSNGAIGWHGYDFSLSSWRAYKEYYLAGFHFLQSAHDIWNMGSYDNSAKIGENVASNIVLKDKKLQQKQRAEIKTKFANQKYKWESRAGFGSGKQGSVLYRPDPTYVSLYNDPIIIGSGNFSHGVNAYGGVVYKGEGMIDPGVFK